MNDGRRRGHHMGGQVTSDTLRRLIEEGDPADAAHTCQWPTEAALRDLAAVLNVAASATSSPAYERAAQEAAAMAAFRNARTAAATAARLRRRALRDRLCRARTAVLAGLTAAVLGGGAAVAAAGGDVPFVGGGVDDAAPPSAPASDDGGTTAAATSSGSAGRTRSTTAATPTASLPGAGRRSAAGTDSASPGEKDGESDATANANERALLSLCTAHARNPHLRPRPLVAAAGGTGRVGAFCETLLAAAPADLTDAAPGKPDAGPRPSASADADGAEGADGAGGPDGARVDETVEKTRDRL